MGCLRGRAKEDELLGSSADVGGDDTVPIAGCINDDGRAP